MDYTFTRGQTQTLYRYMPGAVFHHDDYGLCEVTSVAQREADVNREALFSALGAVLARWELQSQRAGFPDVRTDMDRRHYSIGEPSEVRFHPYPTILKCGGCGRVFTYESLRKAHRGEPGKCPECRGRLTQLPYILAHNCGRREQLYFPTKGCNTHGHKYIKFFDPGRAQQARWQCGICGQEIQRLRMTPCGCEFSKAEQGGNRFLRLFNTADPAVHFSHIVTFVNFDEGQEKGLRRDRDAFALLLSRAWGILQIPMMQAVAKRARDKDSREEETTVPVDELIKELARLDPENKLLDKLRQSETERDFETQISEVQHLLGDFSCVLEADPPRRLVEHVTILDELSTLSPVDASRAQSEAGRSDVRTLEEADQFAHEKLGFSRLRLVEDFPIAVAAFGYSRVTRRPGGATLVPFPQDESGRVPIYVVPSETEGILIQLSPERVLKWLADNDFIPESPPGPSPWANLFHSAPSLLLDLDQGRFASKGVASAVYALLHTVSHILLRGIEWSGFSPQSVGEYLLPGSLSAVLYLSRYEETKLGGLATLFEEHLQYWLIQAYQEGRNCVYDPVCEDEGAACSGCLYREYNCPEFNGYLSRSLLYGGPLDIEGVEDVRSIRRGFWDSTE